MYPPQRTRSPFDLLQIAKAECTGHTGLLETDLLVIADMKNAIATEAMTFGLGSTDFSHMTWLGERYYGTVHEHNHRIKSTLKALHKLYDDSASYLANNPEAKANICLDYLAWSKVAISKVPNLIPVGG